MVDGVAGAMPGLMRQGSPARLRRRTNRVTPSVRAAVSRKAPWVRKSCRVTSFHDVGTAGNSRMMPPQLWHSMSCNDWDADRGVSTTGPASVYIVLARTGNDTVGSKNLFR